MDGNLGGFMKRVTQKQVYKVVTSMKSYPAPVSVLEHLCFIHSEVSEAVEACRIQDEEQLRDGLADIVVSVMCLCEKLGIDLNTEIYKKHSVNIVRSKEK